MDHISFLASPRFACDMTFARPGETILLFLVNDKTFGWVVGNARRGRMLVSSENGKKTVRWPEARDLKLFGLTRPPTSSGSRIDLEKIRDMVNQTRDASVSKPGG
jgi:hypothetical protein